MSNNIITKLNEISKAKEVALKAEKVELGLVDDVKKLKKKFDSEIKPAFKDISKEKSILMQKGKKAEQTVNKVEGEIEQSLKLIEKAAKDLGVSPNDVDGYTALKSVLSIVPDMRVVFRSVQ